MQVFAVFGMADSVKAFDRAREQYPANHKLIDAHSFLVAAQGMTTQDVATSIGLDKETGIVIAVAAFWGFHNRDTWEWMSVKEKA